MSALTIRLPDDTHPRLRARAESRDTTLNRLIDDTATLLLAEVDAETRFKLRPARDARAEPPHRAFGRKAAGRRMMRLSRSMNLSCRPNPVPDCRTRLPYPIEPLMRACKH